MIVEMGRAIFDRQRPDDTLSPPKSVSYAREGDRYQLTFWLPNVAKEDLDVGQKDAELILTAGNYTRVFSLPDMLVDRQIGGASFADGKLTIAFD